MDEGSLNSETSSASSRSSSPQTHFHKYRKMSSPESDDEFSSLNHLNDEVCIKVGICAMNKKTYSRPMKEILKRLRRFIYLDFIVFPDEVVLNEPVENWPIVDCLISFYSKGFPLEKAIQYAKMRKPLVINDLEIQYQLQDRREIYKILREEGLEIPRHAVFTRNSNGMPINEDIEEFEDTIIVNGEVFNKPFVEKPISAEDHNIYIYYPSKAGGGCQILFRKIGSRSSVYSSESRIRRTGSYIYEDFMPTDGTDVKVYTVGEEYAHAEARKSPVLDGKVERDSGGKELRYPVILSAREKLIAKRVCKIFKQTVCGFDLLRANGKSLVCDVNGFSFVKTSQKYYDDCSQLLADMILQNLAPQLWIPQPLSFSEKEQSVASPAVSLGTTMELRCVIAIIRHGDRTPKQKMKMVVTHQLFIDLFNKYGGPNDGQLKIKNPMQLQEILDITRTLLEHNDPGNPIQENKWKLSQMKSVLEMYGHFSGINRKVQLKAINDKRNYDMLTKLKGRNKKSNTNIANLKALLLILKWGGELTAMGKKQAEDLGRAFRCVYPGGQGEYGRVPGFGFLRLHSTYRHDLKIYASDEGRVQMTAAAFAKGLLALEGELTPVLVSLVKSDKHVTDMLDTPADTSGTRLRVKSRLHDNLHSKNDYSSYDEHQLAPGGSISIIRAMREVGNPYKVCKKVHTLIKALVKQINEKCSNEDTIQLDNLYHEESLSLMKHRWEKLEKDFKGDEEFDISLIPDIYDCVKYDYLHNRSLGLTLLPELYKFSKSLADIVIPLEYGITPNEKLGISKSTCNHFYRKIQADLQYNVHQLEETVHRLDPRDSHDIATPHRHVRTRLYFTSESHVHSVISALQYGSLFKDEVDSQWENALEYIKDVPELNYLTQIVLMQYEDPKADPLSEDRFHIEVFFSPGVRNFDLTETASEEVGQFDDISSCLAGGSLDNRRRMSEDISSMRSLSESNIDEWHGADIRKTSVDISPTTTKLSSRSTASSPPVWLSLQPLVDRVNTSHLHPKNQATLFSTAPKKVNESVSIRGVDVIETTPAFHPLICLHRCVGQKQMENFLQDLTDGEEEVEVKPLDDNRLSALSTSPEKVIHYDSIPLFTPP